MPYADPVKQAQYHANYRWKNRDRLNANSLAYHHEHKDDLNPGRVDRNRFSKYRVNPKTYQHMMWRQAGLCIVCTNILHPGEDIHIDHDHACCPGFRSCGHCVRGLICLKCNLALGYIDDSSLVAHGAAVYLDMGESARRARGKTRERVDLRGVWKKYPNGMPDSLTCEDCGEEKPILQFRRQKLRKSKFNPNGDEYGAPVKVCFACEHKKDPRNRRNRVVSTAQASLF